MKLARMVNGRCRGMDGRFRKRSDCRRGSQGLSGAKTTRAGCRDEKGAFIPIAQCNPPWARKRRK